MTEGINVPLTAPNGEIIGRAKVYPDGRVDASIDHERAAIWRGLFLAGMSFSIGMNPEIRPIRPTFDTRPIYKKAGPRRMKFDESAYVYMEKARKIVDTYIRERLDKSDPQVPEFTVYIVWFSKTLQNWKALLSTTLPDGMYYEVTYNGDERETYLDAYKKVENVTVADTLEFDMSGKTRGSDELLG